MATSGKGRTVGIWVLRFLLGVAFLAEGVKPLAPAVRKIFSRVLVLNFGYDKESAEVAISEGRADAVSFGTLFLANPDLPKRFEFNAGFNTPDRTTFYGGTEKGYTDYLPLNREGMR